MSNAITALQDKLSRSELTLSFDPVSGYLKSVLEALAIPVESQVLVYAQTSFQAKRISRTNPRAVYFNDGVAVGWVRGGDVLEVAVQDPKQGVVFYTIPQTSGGSPAVTRDEKCLRCHLTWEHPGRARALRSDGIPSAQRQRIRQRLRHRPPCAAGRALGRAVRHGHSVPESMGNLELIQPKMSEQGPAPVPAKASLEGTFDTRGFPTMFSDVVALMLLEHQVHATNLITRVGWEYRIGSSQVQQAVDELVDYLLFVGRRRCRIRSTAHRSSLRCLRRRDRATAPAGRCGTSIRRPG